MNPSITLMTVGDFTLTAYGLMGAGFALLSALLVMMTTCWKKKELNTGLTLAIVTIPVALIGARLVYILTMWELVTDPDTFGGAGFIFQLWQGGYTLYGGILGGMLAIWLYGRATRQSAAPLLDAAAPGAALMLMGLRAAEYFTGQGLGDYLDEDSPLFFPLAVMNQYESWQVPVFFYEAVAAALILVALLVLLRRGNTPNGQVAEAFILLLGLSQILMESLREDEFIRFGFVRFNQLMGAATAGIVMGKRLWRAARRQGRWNFGLTLRGVLFLLGIGMCILIEFALDKSTIDNGLLYLVMLLTLVVMGAAACWPGRRRAAR